MPHIHPASLPVTAVRPPRNPPDQRAHAALRWGLLWLGPARASHAVDAMIDDRYPTEGVTLLTGSPPPTSKPLAVEWVTPFGELETAYGTISSVRTGLRGGDPRHALFVSTLRAREF